MEPVLIYTDSSFEDAGAVRSFSLDMAFGSDEQDFEATFSEPKLNGGELIYLDGTEYGGIVDSIRQDTDSQLTTYCGRTWHGMLAAKVVKPPANSNYYTASGDANACLAALISYVGLSGVLTARSASSGISIANYQMPRFSNAYACALGMLGSANAKLVIKRHDGITEVWAEPVSTIEDRADSDLMEFEVTENHRVPNHLVAAGQGELQDRVVVDLYADANGNVSTTQTFTGVDEITVYYDYTGADAAELVKEGTDELRGYQSKGGADIKALAVGDWYVGDRLQVRDNRTGTVVTSTIAKKIVRVDMGVLSVDYEVGENVGTKAASFTAEVSGHVESNIPQAMLDKLATITSTPAEMQITSANGLRRLCLTGYDNIRVDTRASTSDAFETLYYAATAPTTETTIANIITQTSAQSSANPISSATYYKHGAAAMLEIAFKPAAARAAGTAFDLGTVVSGKRPHLWASGGSQTIMARMTTGGAIQVVPRGNLTAGTTYTIGFTYLL